MIDCQPQIHVAAVHIAAEYRSFVPGLAVLCTKEDLIASAGVYQNSLGSQSIYLVGGMYLGHVGKVRYGLIAGAVNGYLVGNGDFIPMAAGVVSFPMLGTFVHLAFVPAVTNYSPALIQISFSFK